MNLTRFFGRAVLMGLIGLVAISSASAQPALTEREAVRLGLETAQWRAWAEQSLNRAETESRTIGLWDNPEFEFADESLDLPGGNTDRFFWLRQSLDLTGRRGLERASARAALGATRAAVELRELERSAGIRQAFYRALRAQQDVDTLSAWRDRLARLSDSVKQRYTAGDASRFDALRLEREVALLNGRLASRRAELDAARARLFGLLNAPPRALAGTLLPSAGPPLAEAMARVDGHPTLTALRAEAESQQLVARAAGRERWPEVTLGLGVRDFSDATISETGGVFSIGVELPLFDRGQRRRDAAESVAGERSAEAALTRSRLDAEVRALTDELARRREAALAMRAQLRGDDAALHEIAESAYRGGELSVMELLDAWQTEIELRLSANKLEHAARTTHIELSQLIGEPE